MTRPARPIAVHYPELWSLVEAQFPLEPGSIHGPLHWRRVERIGLRIASSSGADTDVVRLFALFHDSRRENEHTDPDHGLRGALLASAHRGEHFELDDERFELLRFACTHHTDGLRSDDPTIGTCWDADRLDLARLGIQPCDEYLSTREAKLPDVQEWAMELARETRHGRRRRRRRRR
jgi:uncharacterized protein